MAFTFRSASSAANGSGSQAINMPAGTVEGDLMVAFLSMNGNTNNWLPLAGWKLLFSRQSSGSTQVRTSAMYYRVAGPGEAGPYTFPTDSTLTCQGGIASYTPDSVTSQLNVWAAQDSVGDGTTMTAPSVTTTKPGCLIIRAFASGINVSGSIAATSGTLNARERFEARAASASRAVALYDEDQVSAGATGTQTATQTVTAGWNGYTVAFNTPSDSIEGALLAGVGFPLRHANLGPHAFEPDGGPYILGLQQNDNNSAVTSWTSAAPAGTTTGDLLLAYIASRPAAGDTVVTPPSGWQAVPGTVSNLFNVGGAFGCWYKVAGAGDTGGTTYTWGSSNAAAASIMTYRIGGYNAADPFGGSTFTKVEGTTVGSITAPSVVLDTANGLLLTFANTGSSFLNFTFPSPMVERYDVNVGSGASARSFGAASQRVAAPGASGTRLVTFSGTVANSSVVSVAVNAGTANAPSKEYYFFGVDPATPGQVDPQRASNPMVGFGGQTLKTMSSGAAAPAIEAMGSYKAGDVIHIATQVSTGQTYYNAYDMASDSWLYVTSETAVAAASFAPVTGTTFVDLKVRSNGEVVIVYNAGQTAMSSTFNMVRYVRRTGANTYSAPVNVDNGGSVNWAGGVAVLGASDRVHFFFKDVTNSRLYQRTLTAANALQTFPANYATSTGVTLYAPIGPGTSFISGANTICCVPEFGNGEIGLARLTSSDAPTAVHEQVTPGTDIGGSNNMLALSAQADGSTVHFLYRALASADLMHDKDAGTATWGTDVNELAGTINYLTSNIYDRSGTKLAAIIDNAGLVEYIEIGLVPPATLTQTTFRGRNDDGSETTATWKATAGTDWTQDADIGFRVRFLISSSVGPPTQYTNLRLMYSLNGGAYTPVTTTSPVVQATDSPNLTDGANTTEQLAGSGAFSIGKISETGAIAGFQSTPALGQDTENEYTCYIVKNSVVHGDTISLRLYDNSGPLGGGYTDTPVLTVRKPTFTQTAFRARNDDGSETTATWKAALNTNWLQPVDQNFRLRFLVSASVAAPVALLYGQPHYSLNGGAWTPIDGSSSVVRSSPSPNVADSAQTTEQLGGPGGFIVAEYDESDGVAWMFGAPSTSTSESEPEYCLQIRSADVSNGDTIGIRLHDWYPDQIPLNGGYTQMPTITVVEGIVQDTFRGRNDDGSETTATWKAAAGTNWTQQVDQNFRVRFGLRKT